MEDIARLVNRIVVMHRGKIAMEGNTREVFKRAEELEKLGLRNSTDYIFYEEI